MIITQNTAFAIQNTAFAISPETRAAINRHTQQGIDAIVGLLTEPDYEAVAARWTCESDGSVYVRWRGHDLDNISRFTSREIGEDFAHKMVSLGFAICIGSKEWVEECRKEDSE